MLGELYEFVRIHARSIILICLSFLHEFKEKRTRSLDVIWVLIYLHEGEKELKQIIITSFTNSYLILLGEDTRTDFSR